MMQASAWGQWPVVSAAASAFPVTPTTTSVASSVSASQATVQYPMNLAYYGSQPVNSSWPLAQQQQWQQWEQWQQQYTQWHQQYGEKYAQLGSLGLMQGMPSVGGVPPPGQVPPLPSAGAPVQPPPPSNTANQSDFNTASITAEARADTGIKRSLEQSETKEDGKKAKTSKTSKPESLQELIEAEKAFDEQFKNWEDQFLKWKEQNSNHPDKVQYREYEQKWESWREQLHQKREVMRKKREAKEAEVAQAAAKEAEAVAAATAAAAKTNTYAASFNQDQQLYSRLPPYQQNVSRNATDSNSGMMVPSTAGGGYMQNYPMYNVLSGFPNGTAAVPTGVPPVGHQQSSYQSSSFAQPSNTQPLTQPPFFMSSMTKNSDATKNDTDFLRGNAADKGIPGLDFTGGGCVGRDKDVPMTSMNSNVAPFSSSASSMVSALPQDLSKPLLRTSDDRPFNFSALNKHGNSNNTDYQSSFPSQQSMPPYDNRQLNMMPYRNQQPNMAPFGTQQSNMPPYNTTPQGFNNHQQQQYAMNRGGVAPDSKAAVDNNYNNRPNDPLYQKRDGLQSFYRDDDGNNRYPYNDNSMNGRGRDDMGNARRFDYQKMGPGGRGGGAGMPPLIAGDAKLNNNTNNNKYTDDDKYAKYMEDEYDDSRFRDPDDDTRRNYRSSKNMYANNNARPSDGRWNNNNNNNINNTDRPPGRLAYNSNVDGPPGRFPSNREPFDYNKVQTTGRTRASRFSGGNYAPGPPAPTNQYKQPSGNDNAVVANATARHFDINSVKQPPPPPPPPAAAAEITKKTLLSGPMSRNSKFGPWQQPPIWDVSPNSLVNDRGGPTANTLAFPPNASAVSLRKDLPASHGPPRPPEPPKLQESTKQLEPSKEPPKLQESGKIMSLMDIQIQRPTLLDSDANNTDLPEGVKPVTAPIGLGGRPIAGDTNLSKNKNAILPLPKAAQDLKHLTNTDSLTTITKAIGSALQKSINVIKEFIPNRLYDYTSLKGVSLSNKFEVDYTFDYKHGGANANANANAKKSQSPVVNKPSEQPWEGEPWTSDRKSADKKDPLPPRGCKVDDKKKSADEEKRKENTQTTEQKVEGNKKSEEQKTDSPPTRKTVLIEDLISPPGRHKRPPKIVIIFRGPPGSGKTYAVKLIKDKEVKMGGSAPRILSLDDYFQVEVVKEEQDAKTGKMIKKREMQYVYEEKMVSRYQESLVKSFKRTISDGFFLFVIVDCINNKLSDYEEMYSFAKTSGFQVYVVEMDKDASTCGKRNINKRTEAEISEMIKNWQETPSTQDILDIRSLLQSEAITEIKMADVNEDKKNTNENKTEHSGQKTDGDGHHKETEEKKLVDKCENEVKNFNVTAQTSNNQVTTVLNKNKQDVIATNENNQNVVNKTETNQGIIGSN